ncbi:MAG: two-component sensor histidine kinase [Spirulina sp. SIO3F2]|nr:two-component sensor histidine kinase [Spirulina sp. SIO3F2]
MTTVPSPSTSFRRFLLSRLLWLIVPILLLGVGTTYTVTYRKARSALLETARQNLTESAIRYGSQVERTITSATSTVATTAQILSTSTDMQATLTQLSQQQLPYMVHCLQTYSVQSQELVASTCGSRLLQRFPVEPWPSRQPSNSAAELAPVIEVLLAPATQDWPTPKQKVGGLQTVSTLNLRLASPIYQDGGLTQVLIAEVGLSELTSQRPSSLAGVPMIIDADQRILSHPVSERVGRYVQEQRHPKPLETLVKKAVQGENKFTHLYSLTEKGEEHLAGYTAIASPLPDQPDAKWVIIAFTPLEAAIAQVKTIQQVLLLVLVLMTLLLSGATVLAVFYVAQMIARPVELLRDAVLDETSIQSSKIPYTSSILEFNQLTDAVNSMIRRLVSWTEELEGAWQEARMANQHKDEFLANISDQLRTPLNGLIGSLQILQHELYESPEEQQEFLTIAEEKTLCLKDLIDDLLTLSLLERGDAEVAIERFNLHEVLQQALKTQELAAHNKNLVLEHQPLGDGAIWVHGDGHKLQRVLSIVLENAIKFTATGQIDLSIEILPTGQSRIVSPSGQVARIVIQDTGVGIPLERQKQLFRPFVKAHDTEPYRGGKSTGLGLAIARNFMQLMGGDIALSSAGLNQGTRVWMDLPIAKQV